MATKRQPSPYDPRFKAPELRRNARLNIRFTAKELAQLEEAALASQRTVSDYARGVLLGEVQGVFQRKAEDEIAPPF